MISDLKIVLEKISNIFFTKRCEFCGEVIEFDKTVCPDCENLPVNKPPYCTYCGVSKENVIATSIKVNISKLWHRIYIKIMLSVLF